MSLKATGDARRPERWYDTERCTQELGLTVSSTLASGFTSKSRQVIKQASSCSCSSRSDKSCHAEQAQPPLTLAGPAQLQATKMCAQPGTSESNQMELRGTAEMTGRLPGDKSAR